MRLTNRLVQAPLAGISGRAFRLQARRFGAGLTVTEMISSHGVRYNNRRTLMMLELVEGEHPVAVQLFGSDPVVMAAAASVCEESGADIIDVNMGCPVRKVVRTGAGVALMAHEQLAAAIVGAIVSAVSLPVTVKMRSGAGRKVTASGLAQRLEEAGAAAICIHPRTGAQMWRGKADHAVSTALAQALDIPVIASGDISGPAEAGMLLDEGLGAVMIGRASLGNPWLFSGILAGEAPVGQPLVVVLEEMDSFYRDVVDEMGEERASRYMRKFYGWYFKPFGPRPALRIALRKAESFEEACGLAREGLGA